MKKRKEIVFGYVPSEMDGTEHKFNAGEGEIPENYSYRDFCSKILNQGDLSICVPCSVSAYLNWRENLKDGSKKDNGIDLMQIYNCRSNKGEGMTFKDALHFLRHKGVNSNAGKLKITAYALLEKVRDLQYALVMNGPCIGALPVWSMYHDDFWNKDYGEKFYGYHAISIVGYNDDGFIIRNSWGKGFGDKGYVILPYKDYAELIEKWTIID